MNATADKVFIKCVKCQGRGHIMAFQNVAGGICFDCKGTAGEWATPEQIKRRKQAAQSRREREQAKEIARRERVAMETASECAVYDQRAELLMFEFEELNEDHYRQAVVLFSQFRDELWDDKASWREHVSQFLADRR